MQLYGMGYKPDEIGKLQPGEIQKIFDGKDWEIQESNKRYAYFTMWICMASTPRAKISMKKILDPITPKKITNKSINEKIKEKQHFLNAAEERRKAGK